MGDADMNYGLNLNAVNAGRTGHSSGYGLLDRIRETAPEDQKIGTEHENLFHRSDFRPVAYEGDVGVGALLERLLTELGPGAEPIMEKGRIIGIMDADGGAVTLEPGGQLELSGARWKIFTRPAAKQDATCAYAGRC